MLGFSRLYVLWGDSGGPIMPMRKVTDELLMAGSYEMMKEVSSKIEKRFELSKIIIYDTVTFNGGEKYKEKSGTLS